MGTVSTVLFIVAGFFALLFVISLVYWIMSEEIWQNKRARVTMLLVLAFVLSWLNMGPGRLLIIDHICGGSATNGMIAGGRYFVRRESEEYLEVSRNVYYFTYAYSVASEAAFVLFPAALFIYVYWAARRARRESKVQIAELQARNDIQALYDLIDLLDHARIPSSRGGRFFDPPVELDDLRVAISEKTGPVMQKEDERLTLSLQPTNKEWKAQKEAWLQWVRSHENELCQFLARSPPDAEV